MSVVKMLASRTKLSCPDYVLRSFSTSSTMQLSGMRREGEGGSEGRNEGVQGVRRMVSMSLKVRGRAKNQVSDGHGPFAPPDAPLNPEP